MAHAATYDLRSTPSPTSNITASHDMANITPQCRWPLEARKYRGRLPARLPEEQGRRLYRLQPAWLGGNARRLPPVSLLCRRIGQYI